ncbi:cysteine---tRNA ligase [Synchytrium microbalum]|uniref:cysteine--tRNA ligase n=1 Tax=Synchytrium microbalum TaxID=1806994 RepID=A0A507BYC8_9FUNG|nr:cysteine---tRNA ligase [Synchytrium microbalum]TPX32432.1 cysteine---tRNA ligase [Synchytrium microbalum]
MSDKGKWIKPESTKPVLKVYNTLTKTKEEFIPINGNFVGWYSCGPTVYNWSHLGHARNYMSFDILRRILEDYFGYDVMYVMNITDIDDKIIIGARQEHLFAEYKKQFTSITPELTHEVDLAWSRYVQKRICNYVAGETLKTSFEELVTDVSKNGIPKAAEKDEKFSMYLKSATAAYEALKHIDKQSVTSLLDASQDVLKEYLDNQSGSTVTEPKIFREFAANWEQLYFEDMDLLNIRRPDVLTRVSEYVPEIVEWTEVIVQNGYAYEAQGSVYFDTQSFQKKPTHTYAKLAPSSANNLDLIAEGEGSLTGSGIAKRSPSDFALWKSSKPGEPAWPSPWGLGRPGWHIECSTMASEVLGSRIDVHTGGIDLVFPHHDNEIAQSEAYYDHSQWVNYFWHAGHLHIEGKKMSKSLKNFITIREALQQYSAVQIRYMFLMHSWGSLLDYSEGSMAGAKSFESAVNKFLLNAKSLIQESRSTEAKFTGAHNFRDDEKRLSDSLKSSQMTVHAALCDSFDTPEAIRAISDLIGAGNIYISAKAKDKNARVNPDILEKTTRYVNRMLKTFGILGDSTSGSGGGNVEDIVQSEMRALAAFRDKIRDLARQKGAYTDFLTAVENIRQDKAVHAAFSPIKAADIRGPYLHVVKSFVDSVESLAKSQQPHIQFLSLSDKLRDEQLAELGVALDDREDGTALVKFVDPELLLAQRDEKRLKEQEKLLKKEEAARAAAAKRAERLAKGATPPSELFRTSEYSRWDEKGIPTHDAAGAEISKGKAKKAVKEYDAQSKLHDEYLKEVNGGSST